ncbi:uncharacterized protein BX663DRAFT_519047 [Cokeromyces recurvatus]|uniref:uncharacterized protein n=1 Tax=Cokeromyces recurvatus TaxID=90255 RepID=UPI00221F9041|nr:uncharacterized protein BX663DRAFT_519047 [Cokeromyces recurvatus]KAI7899940.1 hypothetical protein BX663DRAFT_519047 [Cokeromyces recurvatus]
MLVTTIYHYCFFIFAASQLVRVYADEGDSNNNNSTEQRPANLPHVGWTILRIDPSSRENLCQRQIAYCFNNCGGPNNTPKNFCNATSMAWNCGCDRKEADFAPYLWPVVQAECTGKSQDCQLICNQDKVNPSACSTACTSYYQCGTEFAPPSYLETENSSDEPSYDGPPLKKTTGATNTTTAINNSTIPNLNNNSSSPSRSDATTIIFMKCHYGHSIFYLFISILVLFTAGVITLF